MKKDTWKIILQVVISVLTAIATTLGEVQFIINSCSGRALCRPRILVQHSAQRRTPLAGYGPFVAVRWAIDT